MKQAKATLLLLLRSFFPIVLDFPNPFGTEREQHVLLGTIAFAIAYPNDTVRINLFITGQVNSMTKLWLTSSVNTLDGDSIQIIRHKNVQQVHVRFQII